MHHCPSPEVPVKEGEGPSIPCFEVNGDCLNIVKGKSQCRYESLHPPVVTHKWCGEVPMCGYKPGLEGGKVPMIIRGRQDVSRMYQTFSKLKSQILSRQQKKDETGEMN